MMMATGTFVTAVACIIMLHLPETAASQCACSTTAQGLHLRSTPSATGAVLATVPQHTCLPYDGQHQVADSYTWFHLTYNGQSAWAASNWLVVQDCSSGGSTSTGTNSVQLPGCPKIVTRAQWGARAPTNHIPNMSALPIYVFVHHSAGPECFTPEKCTQEMHVFQSYHMDTRGYSDTGYNFVVGEDGNAYEARGWNEVGAHTLNYNHNGIAICVVGDFTSKLPNAAALNTVKQLIQCGLDNHKIAPTYTLKGHRDVGSTACPGTTLYNLIHSWPHYVAAKDLFHG